MLTGSTDSIAANTGNFLLLDFGFDVATTGVGTPGNITSFGLFPNPSTDGRFNVSFDAAKAVSETVISVTNATGQLVAQRKYRSKSSSFFEEMSLGTGAKGIYFVEVLADGERIVRKVVVE